MRAGKILYAGLSNFTGWQVQKVVDLADHGGLARPVTLQPQYNLLVREIEWEIVPACRAEGLGLLPWSPLGGGWLTGKYTRDEAPTGATRLGENPERGVEAYDRRSAPGAHLGRDRRRRRRSPRTAACSMAQVALAWLHDRPAVTSVILGARTLDQLDDNLGAAGLHLTPEETARARRRQRPRAPPTTPTAARASSSARGVSRAAASARSGAQAGPPPYRGTGGGSAARADVARLRRGRCRVGRRVPAPAPAHSAERASSTTPVASSAWSRSSPASASTGRPAAPPGTCSPPPRPARASGDVLWWVYADVLRTEPFPSAADVFYLVVLPPVRRRALPARPRPHQGPGPRRTARRR